MAHLEALPDDATLAELFPLRPDVTQHALALTQAILRAPGALSPAERELLFAYGSGLNACHYCHGAHTAAAEALGVDRALIEAALERPDHPEVPERLRPLLAYVRKLTESPSRITRGDADAVRAAGWSDEALHEAILVCALNNFFNRWVDGAGVDADPEYLIERGRFLASHGYGERNLDRDAATRAR